VAECFGWTLTEIDETDMVRMLEFVLYYMYWKKKTAPGKKGAQRSAYADQIDL